MLEPSKSEGSRTAERPPTAGASDAFATEPTGQLVVTEGSPGGTLTPLADIPEGCCGMVCELDARGTELQRLQMMGLCLGRRVRVVRQGDPMVVHVVGTHIGLARVLAEEIMVMKVDQACRYDQAADPCDTGGDADHRNNQGRQGGRS